LHSETPLRPPAVAGQFYPASPQELTNTIDKFLSSDEPTTRAQACIVPHAGYVYSGHVAGAVYSAIDLPSRCIVLGPNHRGNGQPLATNAHGAWQTPFGDLAIDEPLAAALIAAAPLLTDDDVAHRAEHSIEVQLPFLQYCAAKRGVSGLRFVPICVGTSNFEILNALGTAIARVIKKSSERILLVASSDMNHYEPDDITRVKDRNAIDAILQLGAADHDTARVLYETVHREHISMCGYAPVTAMLAACQQLGAKKAELIRYATSGDINGDRRMVVGYAGMVIPERGR